MTSTDGVFDFIKYCFASSKHSGVSLTMKYSLAIQVWLDIAMEWLVDDVSWHSDKAGSAKPESLPSKSDILDNGGENFGWNFAGAAWMTIKIWSMRIRVRDHERAEQSNSPLGARRAEQSLRSSLTSGRGSLLAHMLVMLGSLATMLVFARLVANPGSKSWSESHPHS